MDNSPGAPLMLLRILLSFFGGFALAVVGALAWMVKQGDGKLPPLEWIGGGGIALGLIAAVLAWLKARPSAELRQAAAAQKPAVAKSGGLKMPALGKAKEEPVIENFQRRRDPAGLAASVSSAEEAATSLPSAEPAAASAMGAAGPARTNDRSGNRAAARTTFGQ